MRDTETLATPMQIGVSVQGDTVMLHIICGDEYVAQVLYDDLIQRLHAGEGISLGLQQQEKPDA